MHLVDVFQSCSYRLLLPGPASIPVASAVLDVVVASNFVTKEEYLFANNLVKFVDYRSKIAGRRVAPMLDVISTEVDEVGQSR